MPDYGRDLEFGIFVIPSADALDDVRAVVSLADRLGLDLVGIQDHPYQRRFVDTFALIAALAAQTERISLFPDVACLPLRRPAILAKTSASIDLLSGGRFELGLGAGAFWDAIVGYGGPRRSPGEALAALDEAIRVIRMLWTGEPSLRFEGDHYQLRVCTRARCPRIRLGYGLVLAGRARWPSQAEPPTAGSRRCLPPP